MALAAEATASQPPKTGSSHRPMSDRVALRTSETVSRKPIARIMPNESSRARTRLNHPLGRDAVGARQMRSSASCSSLNTVVAPTKSRTAPSTVAATPSAGLCTLASKPSTACAPHSPISESSCAEISPRAASSPKTSPATAITISSRGASENSV
jgi:hypothetical protein